MFAIFVFAFVLILLNFRHSHFKLFKLFFLVDFFYFIAGKVDLLSLLLLKFVLLMLGHLPVTSHILLVVLYCNLFLGAIISVGGRIKAICYVKLPLWWAERRINLLRLFLLIIITIRFRLIHINIILLKLVLRKSRLAFNIHRWQRWSVFWKQ